MKVDELVHTKHFWRASALMSDPSCPRGLCHRSEAASAPVSGPSPGLRPLPLRLAGRRLLALGDTAVDSASVSWGLRTKIVIQLQEVHRTQPPTAASMGRVTVHGKAARSCQFPGRQLPLRGPGTET